jgi:hypothetical protein
MREPGSYRVGWARDEVRKTIQQSRPPTFDSFYRLVDLRRILSDGEVNVSGVGLATGER